MKRAVLRAVDAKRVPMAGREPGLADLVAWLREHPAAYEQLLESAQVATPWDEVLGTWFRWRVGCGTAHQQAGAWLDGPPSLRDPMPGRVWYSTAEGTWRASVLDSDLVLGAGGQREWATAVSARVALDAELVRQGWTLVGGVTP